MKIKKISVYHHKLLKLQLIKAKVYKKNSQKTDSKNLIANSMEQIEIFFKKILRIIFLYHLNNKQIIFVGVPKIMEKKFLYSLRKTNHLFLPRSHWINGILSNRVALFQYLKFKQLKKIKKKQFKKKHFQPLFSIKKQPDLLVILDKKFEKEAIKETYKFRIPTITLNLASTFQDKSLYKGVGNFKFSDNSIFLLLLNSVFKKTKKLKNVFKKSQK